jgi:hypothetical protein
LNDNKYRNQQSAAMLSAVSVMGILSAGQANAVSQAARVPYFVVVDKVVAVSVAVDRVVAVSAAVDRVVAVSVVADPADRMIVILIENSTFFLRL